MKKNKMMRLASALLVLTLLTACVVSGTFAKYTSSADGSATATVAKWSFKVGETEIANANTQTVTFNLFKTIKDTGNTADETDVADNKIAPGTSGSFELKVTNTSEVTAKYAIDLTATNASKVPIEYSADGKAWTSSIDDLDVAASAETTLKVGTTGNTSSLTVYWRWVYEATQNAEAADAADTALGIAAQTTAPTVTVKATVTATQVD